MVGRTVCYIGHDGKPYRLQPYEPFSNLFEAATLLNGKKARAMNSGIENINRYIEWREKRVHDLKPAGLLLLFPERQNQVQDERPKGA